MSDIDFQKFIYNDIGENILDRLFNEGHEVKSFGTIEDYLNLPKTEFKIDEVKSSDKEQKIEEEKSSEKKESN